MFRGQKYVTQRVLAEIPVEVQMFMWECIYQLEEQDYLQVFDFYIEDGKQYVEHKQELWYEGAKDPVNYSKKYALPFVENLFEDKLYIIDDGDYCTILYADEY